MNPYLLLAVSIALGVAKNLLSRSIDGISRPRRTLCLNLITAFCALAVFGIPLIGKENGLFSGKATFFALAALYGVFTMLSQILYIRAVEKGPVSVCALLYACGFLLPTFYAVLFCDERLGVTRGIGLFVLLVSVLTVNVGEKTTPVGEARLSSWLPFALGATAASGGVGILQKLVRTSFPHESTDAFLFCAFGVMAVLSLMLLAFFKDGDTKEHRFSPITLCGELCLAASLVLANKLNLFLSGVLPGSVFFPIVNGGCIALTAIFSGILFREKFSARKICGLLGSLVSLLLISL